jgi:hypothetical protein
MIQHFTGASAANIDDSSSNDNDVSADGGTPAYDQTGKIGEAVDYDAGDYLVVSDADSLDFDYNESFTLSSWIYPEVSGSNQVIISKLTQGGTWRGWEMRFGNASDDKLSFLLVGTLSSSHYQVKSNPTISINTWTHVACVYNGSSVTMYINGSSVATTNVYNTLSTTSINAIDVHFAIRDGSGSQYDGAIDESRVSASARSANWIETTYNAINDANFVTYGAHTANAAASSFIPRIIIID